MKPPSRPARQEPVAKDINKNYGKVPNYLNKYKEAKDEAARLRMMEEERAKMPPGTRLMPEQERVETLNDLL